MEADDDGLDDLIQGRTRLLFGEVFLDIQGWRDADDGAALGERRADLLAQHLALELGEGLGHPLGGGVLDKVIVPKGDGPRAEIGGFQVCGQGIVRRGRRGVVIAWGAAFLQELSLDPDHEFPGAVEIEAMLNPTEMPPLQLLQQDATQPMDPLVEFRIWIGFHAESFFGVGQKDFPQGHDAGVERACPGSIEHLGLESGRGGLEGESDIAYANGKRDFELMPEQVPAFYAAYPSVGHGGTYHEDNGGPYSAVAVAWLKWQLQGDTSASGRGFFVGGTCGICKDDNWQTASRSLR